MLINVSDHRIAIANFKLFFCQDPKRCGKQEPYKKLKVPTTRNATGKNPVEIH